MIQKFVDRYMAGKDQLRAAFAEKHPENYIDLVRAVVGMLHDDDEYGSPDPQRIIEINHGDYQGTLLYIIGASGYQPSTYWAVRVAYGSCSGCDTLEAIRMYSSDPPTEEQIKAYMTLALHIVQGLRCIAGEII